MSPTTPERVWKREERGDTTIVTFTDPQLVEERKILVLGDELTRIVEQAAGRTVVLNFDRVDYLSSHLLAKIVRLHQKIASTGGKLILVGLKPEIHENLLTTNLHKVLNVRDRDEVLGADATVPELNMGDCSRPGPGEA
jgi:anti-anti-sigma factor